MTLFPIIISWLKKIICVSGVLRRTVVGNWCFNNLCGSHLQSQVIVLVSWKFTNPGGWFDWSIDSIAVGKPMMWLAVKTCAVVGDVNRGVARWIPVINNVSKHQSQTTVLLKDSSHPDDLFQSRYVTPGFKPFPYFLNHYFLSIFFTPSKKIPIIITHLLILLSLKSNMDREVRQAKLSPFKLLILLLPR